MAIRVVTVTSSARPPRIVLLICYLGFISLGLPDTLIGVAWPSVRETFQLRQSAVSWIFAGAGCSYFVSSFFAGRWLRLFNVGVLLAASSALVSASGLNFALATAWPWFALGAVLHGFGSGAIDAGLNHYVASHFSARHMNWLHACYSAGAMLGPVVMTAAITRRDSWRLGYAAVAFTLLILASLFMGTRRRWDDRRPIHGGGVGEGPAESTTAARALRVPIVWLHIVLFFVYTGLEVAVGQWSFTVLTETRGVPTKTAGFWVSLYWGAILAGRIGFGFIADRISLDVLVRCSVFAALAGTALFAWNPESWAAPVGLAVCGLGLAAIFPSLMTRTPQRVGAAAAAHAIGFQVGAAMLGAAALPSLAALIAQRAGVERVPITLLAMAVILLFLHETTVAMGNSRAGKARNRCPS
jgi:fucose permease